MKNLTSLLLAATLLFPRSMNLEQKEESVFYPDNSNIEYYSRQPNKSDFVFEAEGKKVNKQITLAHAFERYKYINLIDATSVEDFVKDVSTKGKSNIEIAETFFYFLTEQGIKGMYDPQDRPDLYPKEHYECLLARKVKGEKPFIVRGDSIIYNNNKDYLRHTQQTINDGGGDCEDVSALYASCLELSRIEVAFVCFYRTRTVMKDSIVGDSLKKVPLKIAEAHLAPLFRLEKGENNTLGYSIVLPDSSSWVIVDLEELYIGFEETVRKGFEKFNTWSDYRIMRFQS